MTEYTSITIPQAIKEELAAMGTKNETWAELLHRLASDAQKARRMKKMPNDIFLPSISSFDFISAIGGGKEERN